MDQIKQIDGSSDWFGNTKKFCDAARITDKEQNFRKFWDFSETAEIKDWGLHHYQHSFSAWNQTAHKDYTVKFAQEFFD